MSLCLLCVPQEGLKKKAVLEEKSELGEAPKGIPEFWLTIFRNVPMLSEMLQVRPRPRCSVSFFYFTNVHRDVRKLKTGI